MPQLGETVAEGKITKWFKAVGESMTDPGKYWRNNVAGTVEQINLRTIVLRDVEGVVYTISNGDIRTVANRSKDFAYYVIDLGVGIAPFCQQCRHGVKREFPRIVHARQFIPGERHRHRRARHRPRAVRRHEQLAVRVLAPVEIDATAARLVDLFVENFAQFADHVDEGVRQSAPQVKATEAA